ncbi:MAG TPA: hypothetical protein VFV38_50165 [Ktedonobacteraceae bacterium]|nr:hypothetical protein [Ktedonobacteraceae bacterium]
MKDQRILFLGAGKLGSQVLDLMLRVPGKHQFLVGGRELERLRPRVNLSLLAALQLGYTPSVSCTLLDLQEVERTADLIARFSPDLIVCAATYSPLEERQRLPPEIEQPLTQAPLGPRLPFHLTSVYQLMQAIHLSGREQSITVLNAIYPDVIHPILAKVGLAPATGIGDLANNIPALRLSLAWELGIPVERVDVRLIAARWVSYWMSRKNIIGWPLHLTVLVDGEAWTHGLDLERVFARLPVHLKRLGGEPGLLMTATSAAIVFQAMLSEQTLITHAPGPDGLPGGYPVCVHARRVELALPPGLCLEKAKQINEAGLHLDGIERIDEQGTVFFTEEARAVYQNVLGYDCHSLSLQEVQERMRELRRKYQEKIHK